MEVYDEILEKLEKAYPGQHTISRKEFRDFVGISTSVDSKILSLGDYPRRITISSIPDDVRRSEAVFISVLVAYGYAKSLP